MESRMQSVAEPRTVDEARVAVEQSRQRISSTLDALEDRIVEKKQKLRDRADVLRPVRAQVEQRPFTALVLAIGVGALLGSLGGSDGEAQAGRKRGHDGETSLSDDDDRADREWRLHRRERLQALRRDHDRDDDDGSHGGLKQQLMGAVTAAIGAAVVARLRGTGSDSDGPTAPMRGER